MYVSPSPVPPIMCLPVALLLYRLSLHSQGGEGWVLPRTLTPRDLKSGTEELFYFTFGVVRERQKSVGNVDTFYQSRNKKKKERPTSPVSRTEFSQLQGRKSHRSYHTEYLVPQTRRHSSPVGPRRDSPGAREGRVWALPVVTS